MPSVVTIVMEILRHLTNFKPLLDHFIKTRTDADKAQQAALAEMRTLLRTEHTGLTEANTTLSTQLHDQSLQLAALTDDLRRTRTTLDSLQTRVDAADLQLTNLTRTLRIAAIGLAILLLILIALVAQLLHTR